MDQSDLTASLNDELIFLILLLVNYVRYYHYPVRFEFLLFEKIHLYITKWWCYFIFHDKDKTACNKPAGTFLTTFATVYHLQQKI